MSGVIFNVLRVLNMVSLGGDVEVKEYWVM